MIRQLAHSEINRQQWDGLIERTARDYPYALSWYLDIVSPGWLALVDDDYRAAMPLTVRRKYGFDYLFPPFFAQQLGVFSEEAVTPEVMQHFLNAIPSRYRFIEINISHWNNHQGTEFHYTGNANYELPLNQSCEALRSAYSENTSRNCKKAAKNNLALRIDETSISDVIALFREDRGHEFRRLKDDYYRLLQDLMSEARQQQMATVYGVYDARGALLAAALFVCTAHRAVFLFSGNSQKGRQVSAMHFLFDRFIENHSGRNFVLDFEGSNDTSLARFYRGFGARENTYLRLRRNRLPWPVKWLKG